MIRLALSFLAATLLATGGWSALGSTLAPHQPALRVIGHVYARAHHDSISVAHPAGAAPGQFLF